MLDIDFSTFAKLATSGTASTGQTVTINSTGNRGARISGARDLVNLTAAEQGMLLPWSGTNYGWVDGSPATCFSTPDAVANQITGDIEVVWAGTLTNWAAGGSDQVLVAKMGAAGNRSWTFSINGSGNVYFLASVDGTAQSVATSSVLVTTVFTGNVLGWLRARRTAASGAVIISYSLDGASWTQLGTSLSTTSGNLFNSAAQVEVGARGGTGATDRMTGRPQYASIGSTIGGSAAAIFDPSSYTTGTNFTASTGEVWTLNGGATIVTRTGIYQDGVNDFFQTAPFALAQPTTVGWAGQQVTWTANDCLW
ncbi:MAG: hypothetical protein Q8J78_05070, partial [Moraxellaceae bacterium]|nr:hypothetical protein [Moraxellaceae bacterium]